MMLPQAKQYFSLRMTKGAISIVGVFVTTVPCMITNIQLFLSKVMFYRTNENEEEY